MGKILIEGIDGPNDFTEWLCPLIKKDTIKRLPSVLSTLARTELYPLSYNLEGRTIYPKDFYTAMLLRGFHIPGLFLNKDRQKKDRATGINVLDQWVYWIPMDNSLIVSPNKHPRSAHLMVTYIEPLTPYGGSLKKLEDYKQKVRSL